MARPEKFAPERAPAPPLPPMPEELAAAQAPPRRHLPAKRFVSLPAPTAAAWATWVASRPDSLRLALAGLRLVAWELRGDHVIIRAVGERLKLPHALTVTFERRSNRDRATRELFGSTAFESSVSGRIRPRGRRV